MNGVRRAGAAALAFFVCPAIIAAIPGAVLAQEVTVLCNYEVDWCEAMKAAYEKTGSKPDFAGFSAKNTADLRGSPIWMMDRWPERV